jgi:MerC mercury resistance protein
MLQTIKFALCMKGLIKNISADTLGISASLVCAIHCAVLPLFFSSLPVLGLEILHNKLFEYSMIGVAAIIGCYSLYHGFIKHHHKKLPLLVFITGLIFLILKEVFIPIELLLLLPAATLIISAHILNFRFCRQANHCHENDCNHTELLS